MFDKGYSKSMGKIIELIKEIIEIDHFQDLT